MFNNVKLKVGNCDVNGCELLYGINNAVREFEVKNFKSEEDKEAAMFAMFNKIADLTLESYNLDKTALLAVIRNVWYYVSCNSFSADFLFVLKQCNILCNADN